MDLAKLNSATKYPSILTYHEMGDHGRLKDVVQVPFPAGQAIYLTEKLDGTNGRIIVLPKGPRRYVIGSREEFLYAEGDLISSPEYGIVRTLFPIAEMIPVSADVITVYFFEVFGAGLPAAKEYTNGRVTDVRLFDVALVLPLDILEKPIEEIARWRDHGGQTFVGNNGLELVPLNRVPSLDEVKELPLTIGATYEWLRAYEKSRCDLGGGRGRAEGVIARTADRKTIAKIKFEDYERTLGVKRK